MHQVGGSKSQTQVAICASSEQCSMFRPEQWAIGTFRVQHDLKRSYLLYHISPALFFALRNFCHGPLGLVKKQKSANYICFLVGYQ